MSNWQAPESIEQLIGALHSKDWEDPPKYGSKSEEDLFRGLKSIQLYSMGTPNGKKISILLEELGIDYDAHLIDITENDQFKSGFVNINPNSKIPCIVDLNPAVQEKHIVSGMEHVRPIRIFESGSIMLYLTDKYLSPLLPSDPRERAECMSWLLWSLTGVSPMFGNFGHFFVHAPRDKIEALDYGVARYGSEVLRLLSVLDHQLSKHPDGYICGNIMTLADIATYPWVDILGDSGFKAKSFLGLEEERRRFPYVQAWLERVGRRPAVQRGMKVLLKDTSKSSSDSSSIMKSASQLMGIKGVAIRMLLLVHAIGNAAIGLSISTYASSCLRCNELDCNPLAREQIEITLFREVTGKGYIVIAVQALLHLVFTLFTTLDQSNAFKDQRSSLLVIFAFNFLMSLAYSQSPLILTGPALGTRMTTGECVGAFHFFFTMVFAGFLMVTKTGPKQLGVFAVHPVLKSSITKLAMLINAFGEIAAGIGIYFNGYELFPNLHTALLNDPHTMGPLFKLTCSVIMFISGLETLAYLFDPDERSLRIILPVTGLFHLFAAFASVTHRDIYFSPFSFDMAALLHIIGFITFTLLTMFALSPSKERSWMVSATHRVNIKNKA